MKLLKPTKANIKFLGDELKKGKLVAFPTDTVYGLGAVIESDEAVRKIYEVKNRPFTSPVIILIGENKKLSDIAEINNEKINLLIDKFWPGGLTLIVNKKENVSKLLSSGGETIGVRIPDNQIAIDLIIESGGALATPSANKNGQLSPTQAMHVMNSFENGEINYVLDGGETHKGIESTILDVTKEIPLILRNGVISKEELELVIGKVDELEAKKKAESKFVKKIKLVNKDEINSLNKNYAFLAFTKPEEDFGFKKLEILSENGNYEEAIKNFFSCLHNLTVSESPVIYIERVDETGAGKVLMERIYKIIN
jgi:L-threonylcarbamoyladenylate synthase